MKQNRENLLEQIKQIDKYLFDRKIGQKGELIRYLLENEELLNDSNLMKNIGVVLQYKDNPRFGSIAEKLRCNTVEQYCKYILSASDLDGFCDLYTSLSSDMKSLDYSRDENGNILLKQKDYLTTNIPPKGSCGGRWYVLSNGTEVFIKKMYSKREAYAELIAEQIAKQMGIPHAQYDLVDIEGQTKVISINILEDGEELIHAADILPDLRAKDIASICRSLSIAMKRKYPDLTEEKRQRIKEDFLKITIFDKTIANWDRNPGNWGIIASPNGDVKIAPELDNGKALDLDGYYSNYHRDMYFGKDDHSMSTLLEYCLDNFSDSDKFFEFIEHCIGNINVRKACEEIQREKRIFIPNEEIIQMDKIVSARGPEQMSWWLEMKKTAPRRRWKNKVIYENL
ncbi:MAG: hypothetical protein ACI4VQ_06475 [Clostridia bacterium]